MGSSGCAPSLTRVDVPATGFPAKPTATPVPPSTWPPTDFLNPSWYSPSWLHFYQAYRPRILSPDGEYILLNSHQSIRPSARVPSAGECFYASPSDLSGDPILIGSGDAANWGPNGAVVFLHGFLPDEYPPSALSKLTYSQAAKYYAIDLTRQKTTELTDQAYSLVYGLGQPGSEDGGHPEIAAMTKPVSTPTVDDFSTASQISISRFAGSWINKAPHNDELTRLLIRSKGGQLTIQAFAKCLVRDCDWGEVEAFDSKIRPNQIVAIWDHSFVNISLFVDIRPDGGLEVFRHSRYTEPHLRPDRTGSYIFIKESAEITRLDDFLCPLQISQ
jgi:hypothetical protein